MDVQVMDAQVMRTSLEQGEPCKGDALRLHFAQVMSTPLKRNGCWLVYVKEVYQVREVCSSNSLQVYDCENIIETLVELCI